MTPRPLSPTLPLLAALALAGCLEAGRTGATSDTLEADTTTGCTAESCDDGDPCTWDECVAETGLCQHWQAPMGAREAPWVECSADTECDDGDPCTLDRCALDDACGYGARCVHEAADGCYGCQQTGCDDGNPCTLDLCLEDGSCDFVPAEDCAYGCGGSDVTSHLDALYSMTPGASVKLAGFVRADYEVSCDGDGCGCATLPALADGTGDSIALTPSPSIIDAQWSCSQDHCINASPLCEPLHYDASYWVWGTIEDRYAYPYAGGADAPSGAPRPPSDLLRVWDYCLQTTETALIGRYSGTFTTNAYPDLTFTLEGVMALDDTGALALTLSEPDCPTCGQTAIGYAFPQTVPVEVGDGWISFALETPTICNALYPPPVATLASHRNTLSGSYQNAPIGTGSDGDVAYCAAGQLSLTRLP
ncbi:MAG: hypothetical protein EP329_04730 [Deltaproteobacteria bacterium]|nr:MAG: hypothetical protein EP329_04730 [Deltaproteobacteria bacterium]